MTKSELILEIASEHPNLMLKYIEEIVSTVFDEIETALARGDRVGGKICSLF